MEFEQKLKETAEVINTHLDKLLPSEDSYPQNIYKSIRYSIFSGGKRLRPILMMTACEIVGGDINKVINFACAIEMIHTYSLIHDDLPAMDNDDYRRGRLTNHKVFGDATAILAGDGLLNYSVEVMLNTIIDNQDDSINYIKAMKEIISASGVYGMVSGQVVDIESEGKEINQETLEFMHRHKTGALITASVIAGAIIGGANQQQLSALGKFADNLGLAFQIKDDILDIEGDESKLGKKVGRDQKNDKSTFPKVYGLEKSKEMLKETTSNAINSLEIFKEENNFLIELSNYLVNRES